MSKREALTLEIIEWEGRLHCVYLNNYRTAGEKPWGGGRVVRSFRVALDDLSKCVPAPRKRKRSKR